MAEVTRVPLQPLSRGSLLMLLLGVLLGLAIAGAYAFLTRPPGVDVEEVRAGTGENPTAADVVFVHYTGKLEDGTVFDQSQDIPLPVEGILPKGTPMQLSGVVPGFREAVLQMQRGGKYTVTIPPDKAYGESPPPGSPIPANATLTFDVELVDFMPLPEVERKFQQLQQMMMQQQGPGGGAGAGGAAGADGAANGEAAAPPPPAPAPAPAPAPTPQAAQ